MKRGWLIALAVVLVANTYSLVGVAWNRSGPDALIELDERELQRQRFDEEDSAVRFRLRFEQADDPSWLDTDALARIGFETDLDELELWQRRPHVNGQRGRRAYVALELDPARSTGTQTRLRALDADPDARRLAARHPDRSRVLILPGTIAVSVELTDDPPARRSVRLVGRVRQLLPFTIHVPRSAAQALDGVGDGGFVVRLGQGRRFEPWVESVRAK